MLDALKADALAGHPGPKRSQVEPKSITIQQRRTDKSPRC